MKEKKYNELKFSAVGVSIGKLVEIVEVLKALIPDLYQQNRITSVAYQTVDANKTVLNQRLYPKLEVVLSTEKFKESNEGTQDKLSEKDRKAFEEQLNKRKEEREKNRGRGRGRGRRGGFSGSIRLPNLSLIWGTSVSKNISWMECCASCSFPEQARSTCTSSDRMSEP